jgi:transcription elongation factor Elf1
MRRRQFLTRGFEILICNKKKEVGNIKVKSLRVTSRCTNDRNIEMNITFNTTKSLLDIRLSLTEQRVST